MKRVMILVVAISLVLVTPGCATAQRGDRVIGGAAVGAAAGAAGGAIVGKPGKGAAIGAVTGATVGLFSDLFGGGRYSSMPCERWARGSQQWEACMAAYDGASVREAARHGACAGGDRSACYRRGYHGGGSVVLMNRPMVMPWPMDSHHHYRGCGH